MFGKNNTTYMFPQLVSPNSQIHHSRVVDLNGLDLSIHHDVLAGHYLAAANAPSGVNQGLGSVGDPMAAGVTTPKKQAAAKRDRHSKIHTSQGPRDRRVRLSIGIARKFFDLQELLGFDKPSKTLDWLLTESKSAITDLTALQTKQIDPKNPSSSSSPSEVDSSGNLENNVETSNPGKGKSVPNPNKLHKPEKDPQEIAARNLAKESRMKARARARERTREKMYIKQMNNVNESSSNHPSIVPIQYMNNQLNDFCRISGSSSSSSSSSSMKMNPQEILHLPPNFGGAAEIRKKMKTPSSVWGVQQNLANSRNLSSPNCSIVPFPYNNSTENWDFSSIASSQTNLYAILDQHRFLNSGTSNN